MTPRTYTIELRRSMTVCDSNATRQATRAGKRTVTEHTGPDGCADLDRLQADIEAAALELGASAEHARACGLAVACGDWYHRAIAPGVFLVCIW